ncbi:hypothetical protein [Ralstonia mannitolilytica]|uniref:hypothetical protein n=1 Tax=Ralstonia mannitolilytica TaxID=105219 RepID=UPI003B8D3E84
MRQLVGLADEAVNACCRESREDGAVVEHGQHNDAEQRIAAQQKAHQRNAVAVVAARHGVVGQEDVARIASTRFSDCREERCFFLSRETAIPGRRVLRAANSVEHAFGNGDVPLLDCQLEHGVQQV